ncbi:putative Pectin lyase-like superfamily protein [Quillaja saponaria]|uniref:Pectin lyase-like superfamily protein n=1 Tax=Quillaja saponaria TaxID=32244 RepID=A0AAD7LBM8_QUISA|nr:putative Pectin lyase-like superfamily protein [Quillaja saponaria]
MAMAIPGKACCVLILFFALVCCQAGAAPKSRVRPVAGPDPFKGKAIASSPRPGEKIFNVMQFGAKPGGKADNFQAFIAAWKATCAAREPARFHIPQGIFKIGPIAFAGPCQNQAPIIFEILGTVKASTDPSEYTNGEWVLLSGNTMIVAPNPNCMQMPSSIKVNRATNVLLHGFTSLNAMGFHIFITNSVNIRARRLKVIAPRTSPNTDGIHVSRCTKVRIAKSTIGTGDDCISIVQGSVDIGVTRVTCGPGHGISIGSLGKYQDEEDVRGIFVTNSVLSNTDNGIRIKTWPDSPPSAATGMLFKDITMNNVQNPILIDQEYNCGLTCKKPPSRVRISDVRFINIKGTSSTPMAINFKCSQQFPCQNIHLNNVDIKGGNAVCRNAKLNYLGLQIPPPCRG